MNNEEINNRVGTEQKTAEGTTRTVASITLSTLSGNARRRAVCSVQLYASMPPSRWDRQSVNLFANGAIGLTLAQTDRLRCEVSSQNKWWRRRSPAPRHVTADQRSGEPGGHDRRADARPAAVPGRQPGV